MSRGYRHVVRIMLLLILMTSLASAQMPDRQKRRQTGESGSASEGLIGTWRLISVQEESEEGQVVASSDCGARPVGYLMYDPGGGGRDRSHRHGQEDSTSP